MSEDSEHGHIDTQAPDHFRKQGADSPQRPRLGEPCHEGGALAAHRIDGNLPLDALGRLDPRNRGMIVDGKDEIDRLVGGEGIMRYPQADPVAALSVHAMNSDRSQTAFRQTRLESRNTIACIGQFGNADHQHGDRLAGHLGCRQTPKFDTRGEVIRPEIGPALLGRAFGDERNSAPNDFAPQHIASSTDDRRKNDGIQRVEIGFERANFDTWQSTFGTNDRLIRKHCPAMTAPDRAKLIKLGEITPKRHRSNAGHGAAQILHAYDALLAKKREYSGVSLFLDHMISSGTETRATSSPLQ